MLQKPQSMDECVYFTRREIGKGRAMAWVFRKKCPKCEDGIMSKPMKNGKLHKKAEYYVCSKCNYQESGEQTESGLVMNVEYVCPDCLNKGETTTEFKRKTLHGILSYVFLCQKCNQKVGITKKLKGVGSSDKE